MDAAGIAASVCFPSLIAGFAGTVFSRSTDPALGRACVEAWNDWHHEVWAGTHPGRIIPTQITWLLDPEVAAGMVRANAERGFRALSFAEYRAAKSLVYDTARRLDLSAVGQRIDADAAKLFASQAGKRAADAAIQVLGGYGYMGEYAVERLWRDAKLLEIGGGTLEAHHKNLTKDLARDPSLVR